MAQIHILAWTLTMETSIIYTPRVFVSLKELNISKQLKTAPDK